MCFGLSQLPFYASRDIHFSSFSSSSLSISSPASSITHHSSSLTGEGDQDSDETVKNNAKELNLFFAEQSNNKNEFNITESHCKYYSPDELKSKKLDSNFNIFHNNINGLESKHDQLHQFLATSIDFDVIAITETSQKYERDFLTNVSFENYLLFSIGSYTSRGGSALYVKNDYDVSERFDLVNKNALFETVWIEINNKKNKNIVCGTIYRHPKDNAQNFKAFLDYLEFCLSKLANENKEIYICGDFNIDWLKIDVNSNYKHFYDLVFNYGFSPLIKSPTRVQGESATVIDNILTNTYYQDTVCGNIISDLSDHFSQFASIPRCNVSRKDGGYTFRDYSNFSADNFRQDIMSLDFDTSSGDVNDQFADFLDKLESCVNKHAPWKKINPKKFNFELKPWITPELKKMIRIRNNLFRKKKRKKDNLNISRAYKLFRNRVIRGLKQAKITYYDNFFKEHNSNSNKTCEGIKSIVNVNKKRISHLTQLKSNGRTLNNSEEIANELNSFFSDIGPSTEKRIPKNPKGDPMKFLKNRNELEFLITFVSNEEILDTLQNLENKSSGPNSIPIKLLKLIPDLILVPLCKIINNSFTTGVFPDLLKISKVTPIHKEGPTDDVNNYRPISLLSIFDKIIEKVMYKRLYNFLQSNNVLFKNQFGFRKNFSTTHALLDITEKIKDSIDNKKFACGVFVDIRKAFDTVNHKILLRKLEHYGVRGIPLLWFESYLTNRHQFVSIDNFSSKLSPISSGVPQGSCLGPLLFLIYINDLPNTSDILSFFLFADDTNIYFEHKSLDKLEYIVNKELRKINNWLIVNRLSLNIKKTNFIIFHPFNKPLKHKITLVFGKNAIKECKAIKYLGVMIDSTLSWKPHCDKISNTISRITGIFYKIRPFVNKKTLLMLYYSLVYPHLIYGIEVWGSSMISHISKIISMQKKIVRMITRKDVRMENFAYPPSDPIFHELGILRLKDIHSLFVNKFVYKWTMGQTPPNFNDWFIYTSQMHIYNTRNTYFEGVDTRRLYVPYARTVHYGCKKLKVLAPSLWNIVPLEIKQKSSLSQFTFHLKKYFLNSYS